MTKPAHSEDIEADMDYHQRLWGFKTREEMIAWCKSFNEAAEAVARNEKE